MNYVSYSKLTEKIQNLFPNESPRTYYIKPIRKNKSSTGKSIRARGKLVDKVRNLLFKSGEKRRKKDDEPSNIDDSTLVQLQGIYLYFQY